MHITEIRIAGFKSFVDPTTVPVEAGLTGIVGPNGCGKSNLLEALRWAMGASSARAMRGGEMDDLIFSGSEARPARELAEVTLVLDNTSRSAPAAFNDNDELEVTRRLKRGAGSSYKLNGRTVRGKDIQLIFADASTGANSPALVRQGQISELIASKPQNRRRILEEAARISGLNARRQEAELKLRGAETNLERLTEVSAEVERQLESLKRQARKARKYSELSGQLMAVEALAAHLRWQAANEAVAATEAAFEAAKRAVEDTSLAAVKADKDALDAREVVGPLRHAEQEAAAKVGQARVALARIEAERKSAADARARLETELTRLEQDLKSESEQAEDAARTLEDLKERLDRLETPDPGRDAREEQEARGRLAMAEQARIEAEARLDAANTALATRRAEIESARSRVAAETRRRDGIAGDLARARQALAALPETGDFSASFETATAEADTLASQFAEAETALAEAETAAQDASASLDPLRAALGEAEREVRELEAEARGLERLLHRDAGIAAPPVIDAMRIETGYEKAVAAALGDDLNAPTDARAAQFWGGRDGAGLPALPGGAKPLTAFAGGPDALAARLSQCGLVSESEGAALARQLQPGQRLVSKDGHLWRWDGFVRTPAAPLSEAERLRQKARLEEVQAALAPAQDRASEAGAKHEAAKANADEANARARQLRQTTPDLSRRLSQARERALRAEQARETADLKRTTAAEAVERIEAQLAEAETALAALPQPGAGDDIAPLERAAAEARAALSEARSAEANASVALDELFRQRDAAAGRRRAITRDIEDWTRRSTRSQERLTALRTRQGETRESLDRAQAPDALDEEVERLSGEAETLETGRRAAADRLAETEAALREAETAAREATAASANARETLAATRVGAESATERLGELKETITTTFGRTPDGLMSLAEAVLDEEEIAAETLQSADRRAETLRRERDALGGVNLEAEAEAAEMEERLGSQAAEKADLTAAIARLREGIDALNAEGRDRLLAAFETVNTHFKALFTTLFRGGDAELRLIDAEDPLAAGLEIFAQPPGKRLGTLSLMSGGEQALTAAALIFAVFLSNPAPICVLDEVDAPLDDANVDRFCRMLDEMRNRTDTRFVVITHNAVTMSRMDRLFGVTMREKGVSKLVSVDLQTAEDLVAAE